MEAWTARSTMGAHGTTRLKDERHISRRAFSGDAWLSVESIWFDRSDRDRPTQGRVITTGRNAIEWLQYEGIRITDPSYACLYAGGPVTAETRRGE